MDLQEKETGVLCVANSYTQKYYLNPAFGRLPSGILDELKMLSVAYTEECGGIFTMVFDEEGNLQLTTYADDGDFYYDEISAGLKINQMRLKNQELFSALEAFYRIVFLGMEDAGWEE